MENPERTDEPKAVKTPSISPADRREQQIMSNLGSRTGWTFVEHVSLAEIGKCEVSGGRLKEGIRITNAELGKTLLVGEGVAKKYTDVVIPRKSRANTGTAAGGNATAGETTPEVVEVTQDDTDLLNQIADSLDLGQ